MQTEFTLANSTFSETAHNFAVKSIYPKIWPGLEMVFSSTTIQSDIMDDRKSRLDGNLGIDRIVDVYCNLSAPIRFSIQERFRRPASDDGGIKFFQYRDITVTEWNGASNTKSELYKIQSDLFVYGYLNEVTGIFGECIVVDVTRLKLCISNNMLKYRMGKNKKQQTFMTIKFDDIIGTPLCVYHEKNY